jgi:hypothetical protein
VRETLVRGEGVRHIGLGREWSRSPHQSEEAHPGSDVRPHSSSVAIGQVVTEHDIMFVCVVVWSHCQSRLGHPQNLAFRVDKGLRVSDSKRHN